MRDDGRLLAKFPESPFYAEGGGQVADAGIVESGLGRGARGATSSGSATTRPCELAVERGDLKEGDEVRLQVDWAARHATASNHTATHLLHAALREQLGTARAPGGIGGAARTSCASTSPTGARCRAQELERDRGAREPAGSRRATRCARSTRPASTREELGAMALFGEKYGDEVRMVEVEGVSRELCGGTHVQNTAEVGIFKLVGEGSSAANVRRIEAVTGPEAAKLMRDRDAALARDRGAASHASRGCAGCGRVGARASTGAGAGAGLGWRRAGRASSPRELTSGRPPSVDGLKVVTAVVRRGRPQAAARRSRTA